MFKKIIVLLCSLALMSCQENDKYKIQNLLDNEDYANAKIIVEERLGNEPQDEFYNGAMGYIMAVECLSTNCPKNNPGQIKKIHYYLHKSLGLAKVDDGYFIDFYQKIIKTLVKTALQQENITSAKYTLKEFVNAANSRTGFIYQELFRSAIKDLLVSNAETSAMALMLLQELNFNLTSEQKESIALLLTIDNKRLLNEVKNDLGTFNRKFIGKELPEEFLIAFSPALVDYVMEKDLDSVIRVLEKSIDQPSTVFKENVAVLRQTENVKAYAKGIELMSKSGVMLKKLSERYAEENSYFINKLQNISLKLNPNNTDLWNEYVLNRLSSKTIHKLYENINIKQLPSNIIIANNNQLIKYADSLIEKQSIIPILDEVVFRKDSNQADFTQKTIQLVEKALKVEISKNNLDGIFEYVNYVPAAKNRFKNNLMEHLNAYINKAWAENDFDNLTRLLDLHQDLNETTNNSILIALFEDFLISKNSQKFFKSENISSLVNITEDQKAFDKDISKKYKFILANLKNAELQTILFSLARKIDGLYTQTKLFAYFSTAFSKDKIDDLILDAVSASLEKDTNKGLLDTVYLSGFLINKVNKLPTDYVTNEIIPMFKTNDDIVQVWGAASKETREYLLDYNPDIKNLIKAINNDRADKKITAANYIEKIKSDEFLPFIENYRSLYEGYINQIKGYYINISSAKGPEIIRISPTKKLLQVKVDFISRLGNIENLNKYKLDRGEVISKGFYSYYNPVNNTIAIKGEYRAKDLKVFEKAEDFSLDGAFLYLNKQKYRKLQELFDFNRNYGIIKQLSEKTQDNFHILPEGASFSVVEELAKDFYTIKLNHPALAKPIEVKAKYNQATAEFIFEYDYYVKLFDKTFSAKAKCQLIDTRAFCAVQDKYWNRQEYSVILEALEVK